MTKTWKLKEMRENVKDCAHAHNLAQPKRKRELGKELE